MIAWLRFLLWKLARLALVLLVLLLATFLIIRLIPGDPARLAAWFDATPQDVANVRAEMGLDEPLPVQFANYVGRILHLDLGRSFSSHAFKTAISVELRSGALLKRATTGSVSFARP